jgi:hypothetical protein
MVTHRIAYNNVSFRTGGLTMRRLAVALCLTLAAPLLSAATYELPTDAQLRARADAAVVATVTAVESRRGDDGIIYTDSRLRVEQVLKGSTPAEIVVSEAGGFVNGKGMLIAGSAKYEPGSRVLTFLRQREDGSWFTAYMALGKYRFAGDLLVRDADGIETLHGDAFDVRDAQSFLAAIRNGRFDHAPKRAGGGVAEPKVTTHAQPPSSYVFNDGSPSRPIRWKDCETSCFIGYRHKNDQPGSNNETLAMNAAVNAWTNHAGSFVNLFSDGLSTQTPDLSQPDGENTVLFNYTGSFPSFCNESLGCGIVWVITTTHSFRSITWYTAIEGDVLISPIAFNQTALDTIVGHEIGHTLAFIDTNQNALMNGSLNTSRGAVLGPWDEEALTQVYGPGVPCSPVTNVNVTGGGTIASGQSATLSATASGDGPFTYQWYEGSTGVTTNPVAGATSSTYVTPPITSVRQYWVKVSNSCPSSAASATVTLTPQSCDAPVITTEPASQTVTTNTSVTLTAAGNGSTPILWRWYRANTVGDTSQQVGTGPSFTTGPLTTTTSYWVRMSNDCGTDDSVLATITVTASCVPPAFTGQPSNIGLALNQGTTLGVSVTGTAPITYQWYRGSASDTSQPIAGATASSFATGTFTAPGTYRFWVRATNCNGTRTADSQTITVTVACPVIEVPNISVPAVTHYTTPYTVSWTGDLTASPTFELQEASDSQFTQNVKTFTVSNAQQRQIAAHNEVQEETRFYYRVRAISACTSQPTAWSQTATTVIVPPLPANSTTFAVSLPLGTTSSVTQDLLVPGFGETATNGDTFSITIDSPWLTVFPASGALSAGGTTVQLTIAPGALEVGTTTATITIVRTPGSSAKTGTNSSHQSTSFMPFSVTMVTPVTPDPRDSNPPPGTMIIPAVAHAQGIGSPFQSDVRLVNVSFEDIDYEITYTPSQTDGTQQGKKTRLTVAAGDTVAFDDIVKSWYGAGVLGESGLGTIEIRPLNAPSATSTFASSRTYALDAGGTLGQFIPALRLNQFVRDLSQDSLGRISLQQIANSDAYRTNLGFVEGSGVPVQFRARLLDGNGSVLQTITRDLPAFGHLQANLTNFFGNIPLADGRVEVETISPAGIVSAYASVVNNRTNDPLMVFPVQPARNTAGRYVLAGIAEFEAGDRNFHSDMRIYNAGNTPVTVTLWYYDRGASDPSQAPRQVTLGPGQVQSYNDVLPSLWPGLVGGGSIIATAPPDSSLVLTAQTFSRQPDGGTKGQFIPGVTFREATGLSERGLEVLQLEQSAQFRSNVGVVEVTGKPATIEITMFEPDAKTSAVVQWGLKANEYLQFDRILESFGKLGTVYNGRVSVRVVAGEGRVYAYGSTVDNRTEDPTYVPAQ